MMDKKVKINKIDAIGRRLSLKGEGGQEIGHAYLYILNNDLHQQPFAFIEDIEIKEAYQGSGHGKLLLEEIEKLARVFKCYKIIACSRTSRTNVHQFYKRAEFTERGKEFRKDLEIIHRDERIK